ncbi:hypothetical protein CRM22_005324 [Opisthorchis felineus]|uniref:UPAR/Ly6 domain-containing protein n=1 Tax=Opisthorchis felineus TaxID=147828 RepID=A0A4S2LSZ8_OPIFE|nr:hypothetical protein CRM22_005324 [Opisthorchis felineus]
MARTALTLVTLALCAVSGAKAIDCYECTDCPVPFDPFNITIKSDCKLCSTLETFNNETLMGTEMKCLQQCTLAASGESGIVRRIMCCEMDLCNRMAKNVHSFWYLMGLMIAIAVHGIECS